MSGINNLIAAELSLAAYTPIENYQNGSLTDDEYLDSQGNITALPVGWSVDVNNSAFAGGSASNPTNQFLTFVNSQAMQVVIAFKGSNNFSNFYSDLFPTDEGASAYASIQPAAASALANIKNTYPGYTIVTDGHSLGGGMAQTFSVEYGLNGYGQNSLPIAPGSAASFNSNPLAFNASIGTTFLALEAQWETTDSYSEVNVVGDPATIYYSGGNYLNANPTPLSNPNLAGELAGILSSLLPSAKAPALYLTAWDGFQNHSINTAINLLASNPSIGSSQLASLLSTDSPTITSATEAATPAASQGNLVGVTDNGITYDITPDVINANETDYTISETGQPSQTIDVLTGASGVAAELTVTAYSGPNDTGSVTGSAVDDSDGTSVITTYSPGGSSVAISYAGPNGTGAATSSAITVADGDNVTATVNTPDETATFSGNGTLAIADPSSFTGTISNFQPGDTIDLAGISATGATLTGGNALTVQESNDDTLSLNVTAPPLDTAVATASDGNGGTNITISQPQFLEVSGTATLTDVAGAYAYDGEGAVVSTGSYEAVFMFNPALSATLGGQQEINYDGTLSAYCLNLLSLTMNGTDMAGLLGPETTIPATYSETGEQSTDLAAVEVESYPVVVPYFEGADIDSKYFYSPYGSNVGYTPFQYNAVGGYFMELVDNGLTIVNGNLATVTYPPENSDGLANSLTINNGTATTASTYISGYEFQGTISNAQLLDSALCYLRGTHIATTRGEVPVEQLAVGDWVVTLCGEALRIVWIGAGRVLATRGRRNVATPVIVRKGALADNVPHHDLHVTKAHSLYIDGVLIPVEFLVNHRSIIWDDHAQEVSLYHVELETHDVLLANGAPAESYRDDGNRWLFQNANSGWGLPPQEPYAPVLTGGPLVDAIWRRLLERAGPRRSLPLTDDADLHVVVDGQRLDAAERAGDVHVFHLSKLPSSLNIVSRAAAPAELGLARDPRVLGVALLRLVVRKGTWFQVTESNDNRLTDGFHEFEADNGFRWTDGDAAIPTELCDGFTAPLELVVHVGATARYLADGPVQRVA